MPTISSFYGIMIAMMFDDHAPPHFHAKYGEFKAIFDIKKLCILEGKMPKKANELIIEWARQHQAELLEDWRLCKAKTPPKSIQPLS